MSLTKKSEFEEIKILYAYALYFNHLKTIVAYFYRVSESVIFYKAIVYGTDIEEKFKV